MKKLSHYIEEYSFSHQNKFNILIHKFCVPLIMFSLLGIMKAFPVPADWPLWLDWSLIFIIFSFGYYSFLKNIRVILALLLLIIPMIAILEFLRPKFFILSVIIFVLAWIGQFIGHKIEGKKPSFFQDLFFLFIGPIWTMNKIMAQLGIDLKINNAKEI